MKTRKSILRRLPNNFHVSHSSVVLSLKNKRALTINNQNKQLVVGYPSFLMKTSSSSVAMDLIKLLETGVTTVTGQRRCTFEEISSLEVPGIAGVLSILRETYINVKALQRVC